MDRSLVTRQLGQLALSALDDDTDESVADTARAFDAKVTIEILRDAIRAIEWGDGVEATACTAAAFARVALFHAPHFGALRSGK